MIDYLPAIYITLTGADGTSTYTLSLPGRAYAFSENGNCLVQILKGPTNILGTYFIVNYATTLDFANK